MRHDGARDVLPLLERKIEQNGKLRYFMSLRNEAQAIKSYLKSKPSWADICAFERRMDVGIVGCVCSREKARHPRKGISDKRPRNGWKVGESNDSVKHLETQEQ